MTDNEQFSLHIIHDLALENPDDTNVDVVVTYRGRKYGATFFTLKNLSTLMDKWATTGEAGGGIYMWASHMIVVRRMEREIMEAAIAAMLEEHEFLPAFEALRIEDESSDDLN